MGWTADKSFRPNWPKSWGDWPGGLRHCNQNWKIPTVQTPLGAPTGLGNQPCYEAPGDTQVENESAVINIR